MLRLGRGARGTELRSKVPRSEDTRRNTPGRQRARRRPILPRSCPLSIFGAGELDFRVRDGNGYGLSANVTGLRLAKSESMTENIDQFLFHRGCIQNDHGRRRGVVEVKPSTVSSALLQPSLAFHMRPIKQVVSLRSYPVNPVGNLILGRASRLYAFSAYPCRA